MGEHHSLTENLYLLSLTAVNNMGHAAAPVTALGEKDYALMKSIVDFLTRSSFLFFSHVRGLETIEVFEERLNVEAEIQKSIETFTALSSTTELDYRNIVNIKGETYAEFFLGAAVALFDSLTVFGDALFQSIKNLY